MESSRVSKFCHCCGSSIERNFKFCSQCGQPVVINIEKEASTSTTATTSATTTTNPGTSTPLIPRVGGAAKKSAKMSLDSFVTFKAAKEKERSSYFIRNKGSKRSKLSDNEVKITIAVMEDVTKIKRGDSLPLKIPASSSAKDILDAAVTKHATFNKRFNSKLKYALVFKDGTEVTTVPGTDPPEPFTLNRYSTYIFTISFY